MGTFPSQLKLVGFAFPGQSIVGVAGLPWVVAQYVAKGGFQRVIAAGGFVVSAKQYLRTSVFGVLDAGVERAVTPALFGGVFLLGVGAVGDQHIHTPHRAPDVVGLFIDEGLVLGMVILPRLVNVLRWLVIAGKENGFAVGFNPVAEVD